MASRTTNYQEIQQDELDALRSIYMEDFKEEAVKTGAWNVCGNVLITNIIFSIRESQWSRRIFVFLIGFC